MVTPASIAKHPIHPMLVSVPIGLWLFSLVADLAYHLGSHLLLWKDLAFYTLIGGLVGAAAAAVPGFIDFRSLRQPTLTRIATSHLALNLLVLVAYAVSLILRARGSFGTGPVWLSAIGLVLLVVSGWLGAELVHVHGVSILEPERRPSPVDIRVTERTAAGEPPVGRAG